MKILLAGDTHGSQRHAVYLRKIANFMGCELIIQLGDFGYLLRGRNIAHIWVDYSNSNFPAIETWFLPGNHEDWEQLDERERNGNMIVASWGDEHLNEIPTVTVKYLGRVARFELGGVRFLTVGGAVSVDKSQRTPFIDWFPQEALTEQDHRKAIADGPADVVLCHDAPMTDTLQDFLENNAWHRRDKLMRECAASREYLEAAIDAVLPRLIVHGHMHVRYDSNYNGSAVTGLGCDGMGPNSWLVLDTEKIRRDATPTSDG